MQLIAAQEFITSDGISFPVEIYHEKYKRTNHYKLYRDGEVVADGKCPKDYTPLDIYRYWVRDVQ